MTSLIEKAHKKYVFNRRTQVLATRLLEMLPKYGTILDVGCGDGLIDALILQQRPTLEIQGIDVLIRPHTHIPVTPFNGHLIPFPDNSFDMILFIDVLHHTDDPTVLLQEAKRVARRAIVLKDHTMNGFLAGMTLRFMDWVGNAHHGVVLPYNYWTEQQWRDAFATLHLTISQWNGQLGLYPFPANHLFERSLHFVSYLQK